jgi:hypothetical protein
LILEQITIKTLKTLRKIYAKLFNVPPLPKPDYEQNPSIASKIIYEKLIDEKPCMVARFGSTELLAMVNYLGVKTSEKKYLQYIRGKALPWWWNETILNQMQLWSGFFPPTIAKIEEFCELMIEDMKEVDVLGSWLEGETYFQSNMESCKRIRLLYLDPFWTEHPWSKALENKRILVVHPFASTIQKQYQKRGLLFYNKDILPRFASLQVVKAVQSIGGEDTPFNDWFDALSYMKGEIEKHEFDICLIGCGAYGFPLAAHVKRLGKKVVHMGGSTQLLFGIRGKRWEVNDPHYEQPGNIFIDYYGLPNEHWVRPENEEKPKAHSKVEGSCYW